MLAFLHLQVDYDDSLHIHWLRTDLLTTYYAPCKCLRCTQWTKHRSQPSPGWHCREDPGIYWLRHSWGKMWPQICRQGNRRWPGRPGKPQGRCAVLWEPACSGHRSGVPIAGRTGILEVSCAGFQSPVSLGLINSVSLVFSSSDSLGSRIKWRDTWRVLGTWVGV